FLKSLQQKLLEPLSTLGRDSVNRAFASARNLLLRFCRDIARIDQLSHSIIEGADIDVGVALDQSVIEPPLDFVGVKVATVQDAEDKKFCFHIIIIILQLN